MRFLASLTLAAFTAQLFSIAGALPVRAEPGGLSLSQEINAGGLGSEYVSGNFPGAVLMPIHLWGSVGKPGIHHVPTKTDLVTLLTLAGGPMGDANLGSITIKRRAAAKELVIEVDAEELLTKAGKQSPVLEANDIILVPKKNPTVPSDLVQTLGFIGTVLSITLSAIVLGKAVQ